MKLQIERPYIEAMIDAFPGLEPLKGQLKFGNKVEVLFSQLSDTELGFLGNLYQAAELEMLIPAIADYLMTNAIRGWLFTANATSKPLPYVVTRLDFTPSSNDETGKVMVELKANTKGTITMATFRIGAGDIDGKTIAEIFASKGYLKETPELVDAYNETAARYFDWRAQYGAQFSGQGTGFYTDDPNSSRRNTDWSRKDVVVLSSSGGTARLVNDESILTSRILTLEVTGDILGSYLNKAAKSNKYEAEDEARESQAAIPKGLFCQLPVHAYILMFHLELHHYLWVHVDDMMPYQYQPALKQKLILPQEQTDLIDILTAEMDVLMDDIVAGKSGGTTVLCAGPAGVGKTLTAEVYSEIIQRPLHWVHSGQLGLNVASMETALKEVLTRAPALGAVMLIDEADVYIKRRDDNMTMNAVVSVFLRVQEYFNGLLFLTTNRVDDIYEAIVSRCIAMTKFYPPQSDARRKIWQMMTEQFGLDVDAALIDALVDMFPCATGRDIKGLAKLTAKFCHQKQVAPSAEAFMRCSVFRGMDFGRVAAQA
ncbi:AAA family ATPase [Sulfuriferula sp. AH1]|uniref:AAA family ATPase n=1 Tax=Sulfuriferula sp. AH1 TaxID=1985873 RepID=UPI000B3B99E4|nr:ATP-binding protein [Sulfuriferula sp. AH1]ARU30227.1 AAA family ATPase [Sulfuriferula sp. AH1]